MDDITKRSIVVGVTRGQADVVVLRAAEFARSFQTELVCASVDVSSYAIATAPDGIIYAVPFDPDGPDDESSEVDERLTAHIEKLLAGSGTSFRMEGLAGEPARALSHLADELDARMIVVGTREPGFLSSLSEFFSGSIAAHLSHSQARPVVVVPQEPVSEGSPLPWDGS